MKICEMCEEEHDGLYGTGRFCNQKCARGFSTKAKRSDINTISHEQLVGMVKLVFAMDCNSVPERAARFDSLSHHQTTEDNPTLELASPAKRLVPCERYTVRIRYLPPKIAFVSPRPPKLLKE